MAWWRWHWCWIQYILPTNWSTENRPTGKKELLPPLLSKIERFKQFMSILLVLFAKARILADQNYSYMMTPTINDIRLLPYFAHTISGRFFSALCSTWLCHTAFRLALLQLTLYLLRIWNFAWIVHCLFFNYFCWLASAWFNVCRFVMDECACWINDIFVYEVNMLLMFVMNKVRYPYRCTMNVLVEFSFFFHSSSCHSFFNVSARKWVQA